MQRGLAGKVAIITGGGQGIGRGIACALADEGVHIVLTGRTEEKLLKVADEVVSRGSRALAVPGDVGARADVQRMVSTTVSEFGAVDILINSAHSFTFQPIEETNDQVIELAFRTGPIGALYAMQECYPYLRRQGGSIVNFGSNAAISGEISACTYVMAKEAVRGLTRVAAREWGRDDIRVNCICPTAQTPGSDKFLKEHPESYAATLSQMSLGRLGDPELDIGRAVVAITSDDMRYLTGATLMLNGGGLMLT
jgi:2-hydroxycyclohexanecarboxyl-CoA dehydrogenase